MREKQLAAKRKREIRSSYRHVLPHAHLHSPLSCIMLQTLRTEPCMLRCYHCMSDGPAYCYNNILSPACTGSEISSQLPHAFLHSARTCKLLRNLSEPACRGAKTMPAATCLLAVSMDLAQCSEYCLSPADRCAKITCRLPHASLKQACMDTCIRLHKTPRAASALDIMCCYFISAI